MPNLRQTGSAKGVLDNTKCAGGRPEHRGSVWGLQQQGRAQGPQLLCPVPRVIGGLLLCLGSLYGCQWLECVDTY